MFAFSPRSAHAPSRLLLVRHRKRGFELPGGKVDRVRVESESIPLSASSNTTESSLGDSDSTAAAAFESAEDAASRELLEEAGVLAQGASAAAVRAARARCIADMRPIAQYMVYAPPPSAVESHSHSAASVSSATAGAAHTAADAGLPRSSSIGDAAVAALGAPHRDACHVKTVFVCRLTLPPSLQPQTPCPAQTGSTDTNRARFADAGADAGIQAAVAEVEAKAKAEAAAAEAVDTRDHVWLPLSPPSGRHLARAIRRARSLPPRSESPQGSGRADAEHGSGPAAANHSTGGDINADDDEDAEDDESATDLPVVSPLLRDAVWDVCAKIAVAEIDRIDSGGGRESASEP